MGRQRPVCGSLPLSMVLTPPPLPRVPTPRTHITSERPFSGSFLIAPSLTQAPFVDCLCPGCWNREERNTISGGRWPAPVSVGPPPRVQLPPQPRITGPSSLRTLRGARLPEHPPKMLLLSPWPLLTASLGCGLPCARLQWRLPFCIRRLPGCTMRFKRSHVRCQSWNKQRAL